MITQSFKNSLVDNDDNCSWVKGCFSCCLILKTSQKNFMPRIRTRSTIASSTTKIRKVNTFSPSICILMLLPASDIVWQRLPCVTVLYAFYLQLGMHWRLSKRKCTSSNMMEYVSKTFVTQKLKQSRTITQFRWFDPLFSTQPCTRPQTKPQTHPMSLTLLSPLMPLAKVFK